MLFKKNNEDEEVMTENREDKPKRNIWKITTVILLIIIIILLLLRSCGNGVVEQPIGTEPPAETIVQPTAPGIDPNAGEYVPEPTRPASGVAIPGWVSFTIPANTTEDIVVDFYNPVENTDKYYLTFELRLPDNSEQGYEVLYTSGLVEPTLHIQKITLNRGLEAGEYDAIIHVQPYHMDSKAPTNNADMETKLIVG